jgi:hypothetical protein
MTAQRKCLEFLFLSTPPKIAQSYLVAKLESRRVLATEDTEITEEEKGITHASSLRFFSVSSVTPVATVVVFYKDI